MLLVWKLCDKTSVFRRIVAKMNDRFLEQRINIKFCVNLGKNASKTCTVLSGAYWGEAMKRPNVSEWQKRFKVSPSFETTN
jgi:hypothetical protein